MRLSAAVLATTLLATAAGAREVGFPLVVDHALLRASLARQLGEEGDGSVLVWGTRGGCRSLVLDDLRVGPAAAGCAVPRQAPANLGFGSPASSSPRRRGRATVERGRRPRSAGDGRLRLRALASTLSTAP